MSRRNNQHYWLNENNPSANMGQAQQPSTPPWQADQQMQPADDDVANDPQFPDMPEEDEDEDDFNVWKIKYVKDSIKGDANQLSQKLLMVRDRDLTAIQSKFVEDNLDICLLRQNSNVLKASNEVRRLLKQDFDRAYPATTIVKHINESLEKNPLLNEIYLKFLGLGGGKGDAHRKFVASLIGAVQVGSGGQNEDLIYEEQDYSIRISTRLNARWGDVNIGKWHLRDDDPDRYLKDAEVDRLEGGSPEERDVLRRRVIIESIAETYRERAFIINVIMPDGTICHLGWDLGNSLRNAFLDGKIIVRSSKNDSREAFIDQNGTTIAIPSLHVYYVKDAEGLDEHGKSATEELEFLTYRDGALYLTAQLDLIKEASMTMHGMIYKESLWNGNPSDIKKIMRCVPGLPEVLLRTC